MRSGQICVSLRFDKPHSYFLYKKPRQEAETAEVKYKQEILKPGRRRQSKQNRGRNKAEGVYARPRDAAPLGRLRRKESGFGRRRS